MGTSAEPTPAPVTSPTIDALAVEVARLAAIVDHNVAKCLIVPAPAVTTPPAA